MAGARIAAAAFAALIVGAPCAQAEPRVFRIDGDSATLTFRCAVLGLMPMEGAFTRFVALVALDEDAPGETRATVTVDANSLTFADEDWIDDLQGPGFFDVARFPHFDFKSGAATIEEPGRIRIDGMLTLRGIARPVSLHVRYDLPADRAQAPTLEADTELDRTAFGMTAMSDVLSDDVDIEVRGKLTPAFPPFRVWR